MTVKEETTKKVVYKYFLSKFDFGDDLWGDFFPNRMGSQVIANSAVQSYTGDLWKGAIKDWPGWKFNAFTGIMV